MSDFEDHGHDGDETVEFGWEDTKPLSGRRKKAHKEAKKKSRPGTFDSMGLAPWLLKNIRRKGYQLPTPIQRRAMPLILQGQDVIGMARTGSGKSAAFVIPLVHKLAAHSPKAGARGLILSPTRELALQTHKLVREMTKGTDLRTAALVGGDAMEAQFAELASNPDILVVTPGRLLHHLEEVEALSLGAVQYCVFDEADRLFEMGFAEQVKEILAKLREGRQTLLFSATLPRSLADFAAAGLNSPQLVRLDVERKLSPDLALAFFSIRAAEKVAALLWLVREVVPPQQSTLVFAATRHHVEFLHQLLNKEGVPNACVYGSMDQTARKIHVAKFRAKKVSVLITTDVAARGIDIPLIDNVIHYDFPPKPELFVHRSGRAARAGRAGASYSLVLRDELGYLLDLHLYLGRKVVPAPQKPDAAAIAAAAASTMAGIGGAAEGEASVLGSFPSVALEPLLEHLREVVEAAPELYAMQRSLENAYGLYSKTRPPASTESVKRARAMGVEGPHPLLLAKMPQSKYTSVENEAALAEFTAKLRSFRPTATVLEAEIAKVRPSMGGPTMATQLEAARMYKSSDVMSRKRNKHAHIIELERLKQRLEGGAGEGVFEGGSRKGGGSDDEAADERGGGGDEQQMAAAGDSDESDGSSSGDDREGVDSQDDDPEQVEKRRRSGRHASSSGGGACGTRAAAAAAAAYGGGQLATGRYRDADFFVSHTREGKTHNEDLGLDREQVELQGAVLDLQGEDQGALRAQQRQYRWDNKKRRYINTSGTDERKGNKKIRTESGKSIEASAAGKGLYQKWAKQNKARVAALGTAEDAAATGDLAKRFDKGFRHKSWKTNGEKGPQKQGQQRGPSELKSKEQVAKQRQKKQALQERMQERRKINESKKQQKGRRGKK